MQNDTIAWIGAIGGSVIGVLGGLFGSYVSIKNTNGPRERAFMIKAAIGAFFAVATFLVALWFASDFLRPFLWLPYVVALPLAIRWLNRKQQEIRRDEEHHGVSAAGD
jgi:hypothetical protein